MSDFLALEQPLLDRLLEKVRFDDRPVDTIAVRQVKVDAANEPVLRVPALLVSYDGYRSMESSAAKATIRQIWSITSVIANLRDTARLGGREDASFLIDQVIEAILGWVPPINDGRAWKSFQLADPVYRVGYGARNSYFPLSFTTERVVKGDRLQR